jgi:RNA polymerase sigma factor (sigma-70 family)
MDIEDIFKKPGKEWSEEDILAVCQWFQQVADAFVQFAFGWTRIAFTGEPSQDDLARALAEDVVTIKFAVAITRHLHTYDPRRYTGKKCPFRNWLYVLFGRAAVKASRREKRRREKQQWLAEQLVKPQSLPLGPQPSMSTPVLEWDEEFEILLDQLRPQHREALLLHYKEGLPYGEAAQELHCPVTTIKVWC